MISKGLLVLSARAPMIIRAFTGLGEEVDEWSRKQVEVAGLVYQLSGVLSKRADPRVLAGLPLHLRHQPCEM